jgi:hypothetical protein
MMADNVGWIGRFPALKIIRRVTIYVPVSPVLGDKERK